MKRALIWGGMAALIVLGIFVARALPRARALSRLGTGYVAKQMCSCMFVDGREYASCRPDIPASMDRVETEILTTPPGVRAKVRFLAEREAHYDPDTGCTLY
ncbi:MAG: hypothetical protein ACRDMZ_08100 [Solirubrobacteraceae bacterium]